jgi:hypothetical protein
MNRPTEIVSSSTGAVLESVDNESRDTAWQSRLSGNPKPPADARGACVRRGC